MGYGTDALWDLWISWINVIPQFSTNIWFGAVLPANQKSCLKILVELTNDFLGNMRQWSIDLWTATTKLLQISGTFWPTGSLYSTSLQFTIALSYNDAWHFSHLKTWPICIHGAVQFCFNIVCKKKKKKKIHCLGHPQTKWLPFCRCMDFQMHFPWIKFNLEKKWIK